MQVNHILWVDDEIDLLRSHIVFLENKGYRIQTATNGDDALHLANQNVFSLIFLDENMPGPSGLQVLHKLKLIAPNTPVVMITKSEEENIMDQAIGSKIADYLIKPVNPNQILHTIKKYTDNERLVSQHTSEAYRKVFNNLANNINQSQTFEDWIEIYKSIVYWEIELQDGENEMYHMLNAQKIEANSQFSKFIKRNYEKWFTTKEENKPLLSPGVVKHSISPLLNRNEQVLFLVIDNLRYDQWRFIATEVNKYCLIESEELYYSILPTCTQYSRNSIFAGLMPLEIKNLYPQYWIGEENEEDGKNKSEEFLLRNQLKRLNGDVSMSFQKIVHTRNNPKIAEFVDRINNHPLNVLIFNFVDALSHARTETDILKDLVIDEASYRSITLSWFQHSILPDLLQICMEKKVKVVLTTDHGTIRVNNPIKVVGDKATSHNTRYKHGRNLDYNPKEVIECLKPANWHIPSEGVTSSFIFACATDYMVYPNNYNQYVQYYRNTFQHGGVSMEEMLVPLIVLTSR